jgi:hypothetical protein
MFNTPKECREYVEANPYMPYNKIKESANYLLSQKERPPRSFSPFTSLTMAHDGKHMANLSHLQGMLNTIIIPK